MKKLIAISALSALASLAVAAPVQEAPGAGCGDGDLKIGSGPNGKGYSLIADDIIKACGQQVNVCQVNTKGGLDNLNAMSTNEADVGIAQVDTVFDMKNGDENIAALEVVASLNYNYMHVLTLTNGFTIQGEKKYGFIAGDKKTVVIQRFSDLRGQTVATVGSATLVMTKLNRALGYGMNIVEAKDDNDAFNRVKSAQVAAAVTVSGWPSGTVKNHDQASGLTMVPFDANALPQYVVRPVNYKNLGVYNNNLMAVPNVLLTRPFKGAKNGQVAALKRCVASKMTDLKEGSYQPAWKEVKSIDSSFDLPKFNGGQAVAKKK